jgi:hypothetical protein
MNLHRDRSKSAVSMDMSRIHQLAIHLNVWEIRALAKCLANIQGYVTGSGRIAPARLRHARLRYEHSPSLAPGSLAIYHALD